LSNIFGNGVIRYYFTAVVVDKDEGRRKKREPSCFLETNQGRTASKGGLPIAKGWYLVEVQVKKDCMHVMGRVLKERPE